MTFWRVRELGESVLPNGDRESILVLRAYIDASGQKTDPFVVVAGFVGLIPQWEDFEEQWNPFLREFELDHFHATEFWAQKSRPYCNWGAAKHLLAQGQISNILSTIKPVGLSVALNIEAFEEWRHGLNHYYPSDPYYFCLDRVLYQLIYRIKEAPVDDGITIYCDQEKEHELLGVDIARWHEARLNKDPLLASFPLDGPRPIAVLYGPKRKFIPLQLADILANDMFKKVCDYLGTGLMDDPYFLTCMKKSDRKPITYFFNDVSTLIADYHWRFRPKGQ